MDRGPSHLRRAGVAVLGVIGAVVLVAFAYDFLGGDARVRSWAVTRGAGVLVLASSVAALAWTWARSWRSGRLGGMVLVVAAIVAANAVAEFAVFGFPAY